MDKNRTAERSAKEFRRFLQWNRALTAIMALIPLWFLYVAVVTALGMSEVAPLSLSFGNPVGGVVAFGLIGVLGLVTFAAQFIGAGRQMKAEAAADVHDERKPEVVRSYRMARLVGLFLVALGAASAAVALGALFGASYANAFVKPGNVPLGFGFVALMLIFMGGFCVLYRPTRRELLESTDERARVINANAGSVALVYLMGAFSIVFFGLALLGYLNVVSMFALWFAMMSSAAVYGCARIYYRKTM